VASRAVLREGFPAQMRLAKERFLALPACQRCCRGPVPIACVLPAARSLHAAAVITATVLGFARLWHPGSGAFGGTHATAVAVVAVVTAGAGPALLDVMLRVVAADAGARHIGGRSAAAAVQIAPQLRLVAPTTLRLCNVAVMASSVAAFIAASVIAPIASVVTTGPIPSVVTPVASVATAGVTAVVIAPPTTIGGGAEVSCRDVDVELLLVGSVTIMKAQCQRWHPQTTKGSKDLRVS